MHRRIKAQSILEYAMVVVCIAGALIAMQHYVKRSIQGRLRDVADEVGAQYSAKTTTSKIVQEFKSDTTIRGDPLIVSGLSDPDIAGNTESREFIISNRDEDQKVTQSAGNYEKTGKFSDEKLFE